MSNNIWGICAAVILLFAVFIGCIYGLLKLMHAHLPDDEKEDSLLSSLGTGWDDLRSAFTLTPHKRIRSFASLIFGVMVAVLVGLIGSRESLPVILSTYLMGGFMMGFITMTANASLDEYADWRSVGFLLLCCIFSALLSPIALAIIFQMTGSERYVHPRSSK